MKREVKFIKTQPSMSCEVVIKEYKFLKILQSMNLDCKYLIKITMRSKLPKKNNFV